MRSLTIAEKRENELQRACKEYNIPYETGKHLMNCFYRLNADLDRLSYLEQQSMISIMKEGKKEWKQKLVIKLSHVADVKEWKHAQQKKRKKHQKKRKRGYLIVIKIIL